MAKTVDWLRKLIAQAARRQRSATKAKMQEQAALSISIDGLNWLTPMKRYNLIT